MVGLLLSLLVQSLLVADGTSNCIKLNQTIDDFNLTNSTITSDWDKNKYSYAAIIITIIFLMGLLPVVIFVKEKPGKYYLLFFFVRSFFKFF